MLQFYKWILLFLSLCLAYGCALDTEPKVDTMDDSVSEEEAFYADYAPSDMKFGYINTAGQLAIKDLYDGVREFSEGLAAVNLNGKWGYIDPYGRTIIAHEYRSAFAFKGGIARVQDFEKRYWFIDKTGQRLNEEGFEQAYDCIHGLIRVMTVRGYNYISLQGDTLLPDLCDGARDFQNGLAVVKRFGLSGVINPKGEQVLPYEFRSIYVEENIIRAKQSDAWSLYTLTGQRVTTDDKSFSHISAFQNGKAVAKTPEGLAMISEKGNKLFSLEQEILRAEPAGGHVWRIILEEGVQLMKDDGTVLTDQVHDQIFNFSDGLACYADGEKWGYLNELGEEQIPAEYDLIWDFKDGRARVVTQRGIGFIDKTGELVIPPIFFEVKDFDNGLARVQIYRG